MQTNTTPVSANSGKITAARLRELEEKEKELAKLREEKTKQPAPVSNSNGNSAPPATAEAEELRAQLKQLQEAQVERRLNGFKDTMLVFARREMAEQNAKLFGGKLVSTMLGEAMKEVEGKLTRAFLQEHEGDQVWGKTNAENAVKGFVNEALGRQMKMQTEIESKLGVEKIVSTLGEGVRFNTMDKAAREAGGMNERAYWSDANAAQRDVRNRVMDWLLEQIFQAPVTNRSGRAFYESHRRLGHFNDLVALQLEYAMSTGISDRNMLSPGGRLYESFNSAPVKRTIFEMLKRDPFVGRTLREADEVTTSSIIATASLPVDFNKAMIMAVWPRLIAMEVAGTVGIMNQRTATIYDWQHPASDIDPFQKDKHFFGAVDSDTPSMLDTTKTLADGTVANDESALSRASGHFPQDVWGYLGEVVDATTTITITGTNANGTTTATAAATFYTTDAVGTVRRFIPTVLGDKFMDVTAVSSTGWTDAAAKGEVGLFCPEPLTGHTAGSPAMKVGAKLVPYTVTEATYDLQTNLTLNAMEDMERLFAVSGQSGLSLAAKFIREIGSYMRDYIDRKALDVAIANTYANNIDSFAASTPGEGYSDEAWKSLFRFYLDSLAARVESYGNYAPNWQIWHLNDRAEYRQWMSKWLNAFEAPLNDPFADGRAQFSINGQNVYVTKNTRIERVLMGNSNADTGLHVHTYVPFKLLQAPNPTAGFEQVIMAHTRMAIDVLNGRSLGLLQVTKR